MSRVVHQQCLRVAVCVRRPKPRVTPDLLLEAYATKDFSLSWQGVEWKKNVASRKHYQYWPGRRGVEFTHEGNGNTRGVYLCLLIRNPHRCTTIVVYRKFLPKPPPEKEEENGSLIKSNNSFSDFSISTPFRTRERSRAHSAVYYTCTKTLRQFPF